MKLFLTYLLLGLAPNVMAWNWTLNDGKDVTVEERVVVAGEDGEGDAAKVRTIKVVARAGAEDEAADRGWLGVSIGEVPEALAAQLNLKGRGIVILNVVEGSPADSAGIEAHDIILSINGQEVSGEIGGAVEAIKTHKSGEKLNLVVLRSGEQKTINVTLGSRVDFKEKKIEWKFEGSPDAEVEEHVKTRGKFIMRDSDGNWITKNLGDLSQYKNLPQGIRAFIPESGSRSTQVFVENGKKTIKMRVEKDGATISIEQVDHGEITVRRTDVNGQETAATYENEDALKAEDAEAYELYQEVGASITINVDGDEGGQSIILKSVEDEDVFGIGGAEWRAKLEASLSHAKEAHRLAMEELRASMERWKEGAIPDAGRIDELRKMLEDHRGSWPQAFAFQFGKPKHTFEARADGSIEVRMHKGDSELVQVFLNESDLAQRRPELYKKYETLKAADEE